MAEPRAALSNDPSQSPAEHRIAQNDSVEEPVRHRRSLKGPLVVLICLLVAALIGSGAWAAREPEAPPQGGPTYPLVASIHEEPNESWAEAADRTLGYGFNGVVLYLPEGTRPSWNADLAELASLRGTEPLHLQLTVKSHTDDGLADVLERLPKAWKPGFIYNIHQEPENDLVDAASQAAYRDDYSSAARVCRKFGVQLPWVEWQEWTLDPANTKGWDLADFVPPTEDFGGVLWSMFEFGRRSRIDAQVSRITGAMQDLAPGKPWALMAAGYSIPPDSGTIDARAQALWLRESYTLTRDAGSQGWAWFNANLIDVERRVERNPRALDALRSLGGGPAAS